jgi:hypothetical protein
MIKFTQCVRSKSGLGVDEFREKFLEYGEQVRPMATATNAVKVSLSTVLHIDENLEVRAARGTEKPYDGVLEISWAKGADVVAYLAEPEAQQSLVALRALQEGFMDLSRSSFFFSSEEAEYVP